MRLLILGGTRFLGRHFVDAALARDHEVTLFTRGLAPVLWGDRVRRLTGNRDPLLGPGLDALDAGEWDAVVDTSGYLQRVVDAGIARLRSRVGQYLFVSSVSAYAGHDHPDIQESASLAELTIPGSEEISEHYGALKARCEAVVQAAFPDCLILRPGLIVGPYDHTDRFGYWVARFMAPELLGKRSREVLVPAPPERFLQVIDARDLASWMLYLLENRITGIYNACSPARGMTMASLIETLDAASPHVLDPVWIDEAALESEKVGPWTELPLWIPGSDTAMSGFMLCDTSKAHAHGLHCRSVADTVHDTADWLRQRDPAGTWQHVLSAERERALLANGHALHHES